VYVTKAVAPHIPMEVVFRGIFWFFIMDLLTIAILVTFPGIVLFLPDLMF
jgi:C4-dicarboxylate transporter, DctM subunit